MDSDSYKREQITEKDTNETDDGPKQEAIFRDCKLNVGNVLPAARIRFAFFDYNETNKFLLDYGFYFLLPISIVVYPVFFIFS